MSKPFEVTVTGCDELKSALQRFVREVKRDEPDGWMQGVRLAAYDISLSLSKRTKKSAKSPKFRLATDADIIEIGELHGMPIAQIEAARHAILHAENALGAYVGMKGYTDRRGPYKPDTWISRNPLFNDNGAIPDKKELSRRWRYKYSGLARMSWLTMAEQAKRIKRMKDADIASAMAAVLHKLAVVWVRPETLSIHFHNKLSYASSATPQDAIQAAVRDGASLIVKYVEKRVKKLKEATA